MTSHPSRRAVLGVAATAALVGPISGCTRASRSGRTPSSAATASTASGTGPASPTPPTPPTFATLAAQLSGGLELAGQTGFDPATLLYNPRFATQTAPQAIARCRTAADVVACVRFAAAGGAGLRLRGGGHSYGGWSSGPGLVADLGALTAVDVDAGAGRAQVGAGARLADVYTALDARGMSLGAGSCPTVGITGLTLGGGVGVLAPSYGLACDQLTALDVVLADGRSLTIGPQTEPDLFWALRGGGGGFAAVTGLTFAVRPAPTVTTYYLQWPWSAAGTVLAAWQQWVPGAPRELWSTCKLLTDPGRGATVTVSGTWTGAGSPAAVLQGLLAATPGPAVNSRSTNSYGATMLREAGCAGQDAASCIADALAPAKRQPFAATSSILAAALPDAGVAAAVAAVHAGGGPTGLVEGGISFDALGGAVADVAATDTAFPWRTALALVQHTATWGDAAADPAPFDAYVRAERQALAPWTGSSAYLNYADAAITDYASAYWGDNLGRLQQVKRQYDPGNLFAYPQSVPV